MKKRFLRIIALVLVLCAMQGMLVPSVTAASQSVTYDFYEPYEDYEYLYHWRTVDTDGNLDSGTELQAGTKVAMEPNKNQIAEDYAAGLIDWKIESASGYASMQTGKTSFLSSTGWVDIYMGKNANVVFRLDSPETANYKVVLNYIASENTDVEINTDATLTIIPAEKNNYTSAELEALIAANKPQVKEISCYEEVSSWGASCAKKSVTISESYPFLAGQDYFLVIGSGSATTSEHTYIQSLTLTYAGEYVAPVDLEYPRPVTVVEEAMTKWDDDFFCVTEINGDDYLAVPISGGKMYIYNLDTWQLVNEVNTGINTPRGIVADENGVVYVGGDAYNLFVYDLNTWTGKKSTNFNISGVAAGSLYDIHLGDDGMLYTGTDKGHIMQYNPQTDVFSSIAHGLTNVGYIPSVIQVNKLENGVTNRYIYASMHTKTEDWLVELKWNADANAYQYSRTCDFTSTVPSTYMSHMSITEDGMLFGAATYFMAVDTNTMTLVQLTDKDGNAAPPVNSYVSEKINGVSQEVDGKYYYVAAGKNEDRYLCVYDPQTRTVTKTGKFIGQYIDCQGKTVTLTVDGVEDQYLIATADAKKLIYFINVRTGTRFTRSDLVDSDAGAGGSINSLTPSADGTELYFGGFLSDQVLTYDVAKGELGTSYTASGIQTDALYVYNGEIYAGNYTEGQLTKLNQETPSQPEVLFTLHNKLFNQSRIHAMTGGDGKIFVGTFPYVYSYGGALAWYEIDSGYTYVAVGPDADDVYYSENAAADAPVWRNSNGEVVTSVTGTADGQALDTLDNVDGVVLNQGIKDVAYHNGILYAATSRTGGTNTGSASGTSAVIIAYDVAAHKVIATFDPAAYSFTSPVPMISGIEVDENGTLWCLVSETLFTLTFNGSTFTYTEKLSFDKIGYDETQNRTNSDIRFKDGYVYAAFERWGGLCKVNMADPSDYTLLMPEVTSNGQVPESFAFGSDGNLYYLEDSELKMLVVDYTDEEWAKAQTVTEMITALTADTVSAARQAYDTLTLREKSLVQNYEVLAQAEADAFIQQIANLGEITWDSYDQVQTLLNAYKQLPKSQQNEITNYPVLAAANYELQELRNKGVLVKLNDSDEGTPYETIEKALAAATSGMILLQDDVAAAVVDIPANIVLDLNGHTLTADTVVGQFTDSSDGEGLIQVKKNTEEKKNAVITAADGQLVLWDNTTGASGYRLFNYTFTNLGADAKNDDILQSQKSNKTVNSFWCDLTFENPKAYTLLASAAAYSDLQISFEVSWTPAGGETAKKIFALDASTIVAWALEEEKNSLNEKNFCFYISLTGFEEQETDGLVEVKPILKTAFNEEIKEATQVTYTYEKQIHRAFQFELGFGNLRHAGINR